MLKLRLASLGAEVEGDPKDVASFLAEYSAQGRGILTQPTATQDAKNVPSTLTEPTPPVIKKVDLPPESEILKWIEEMGEPFSFSLAEQQMRIFGRYIDSRNERPLYSKFYTLYASVREKIQEKYGGKWIVDGETVDGHRYSRYTLIHDAEVKQQENESKQLEGLGAFELHQD
jgi:hypothetical protein